MVMYSLIKVAVVCTVLLNVRLTTVSPGAFLASICLCSVTGKAEV